MAKSADIFYSSPNNSSAPDQRLRPAKQLNSNLQLASQSIPSDIKEFLTAVKNTLEPNQEYLQPTLVDESPQYLIYTESLEQGYDQPASYLLPADIISLLYGVYLAASSLPTGSINQKQQHSLSQLDSLTKKHGLDKPNPKISLKQERELLQKTFQEKQQADTASWAATLLSILLPSEKEEKKRSPEQETIPQKTESVTAGTLAGQKQPKDKEEERGNEKQRIEEVDEPVQAASPLIPEELTRAATSYSILAINSALAFYTGTNGLNPLTFEQLPPDLQQALLSSSTNLIEDVLIGFSPQELNNLSQNKADASSLRLKIATQVHRHLTTNPEAHILLQTAVDHHFAQLNPEQQQLLSARLNNTPFSQENFEKNYNQLEKSTDVVRASRHNLGQAVGIATSSASFARQLKKVLNLEEGENTLLKATRFEQITQDYIAANPLLAPSFIILLSDSHLAAILEVSEETIATHREELNKVLTSYWRILRAQYLKEHPQLLKTEYQPDQENLKEINKTTNNFKNFVERGRQLGISQDRATKLLFGGDQENEEEKSFIERFNQEFFSQLSWEEKKKYLAEVVPENFQQEEDYQVYYQKHQQEVIKEFNYARYLYLRAAEEQKKTENQLIIQLQQQINNALTADLEAQEKGLAAQAALLQEAALIVQSQQLLYAGAQAQTETYNPQMGDGFVNNRITTANGVGEQFSALQNEQIRGVAKKVVGELAGAAFTSATGIPLDKIPIIGQFLKDVVAEKIIQQVEEKLQALKQILKLLAVAIPLILGGLLAMLGTLGGAIIGGGVGFILGGPVGAAVGATIGGVGGNLAASGRLGALDSTVGRNPGLASSSQATFQQTATRGGQAAQVDQAAQTSQALETTAGQSLLNSAAGAGVVGTVATGAIIVGVTTIMRQTALLVDVPLQPDPLPEVEQSLYVNIEKTASPNKIQNNQPTDITYTITITPKDGYGITANLEQISDEFSYLGGDPLNLNSPVEIIREQIGTEPFFEPKTISYTIDDVSGVDVMTVNSFTFSFQAVDQGSGEDFGDELSVVGSLIIGDPELGCFEFMPDGSTFPNPYNPGIVVAKGWTDQEKERVLRAFSTRAGTNPQFVSLLCHQPIQLYRLDAHGNSGGWKPGPHKIVLYDRAFGNDLGLEYTLVHESGHVVDSNNPQLQSQLMAITDNSTCFTYKNQSYCANHRGSETFAEGVALYIIHRHLRFSNWGGLYNFPQRDPQEYQWYKQNIFGGMEF
ncbi:MAG: hypothetical protein GF381_04735 [Candidatus Pacebacteria bacterium]|nr:hypothetical protein [Candidatus Paceibacterota bacterium]